MRLALACRIVLLASSWPSIALCTPLEDARRHYQRLQYDEALATLAEHRRSPGLDAVAQAQGWLLEGFVNVALGRESDALAAFDRALRLDANVARATPDLSPKLRVLLDKAKLRALERVRRRRELRVQLETPTAPAVAFRAVEIVAHATQRFEGLGLTLVVTSGQGLRAALPMTETPGRPERFTALVPADFLQPGSSLRLHLQLTEGDEGFGRIPEREQDELVLAAPTHRATVTVTSRSRGAELFVNGARAGVVPLPGPIPVEPGRVHLSLRSAGGSVVETLEVRPGDTAMLSLTVGRGGPHPAVIARYSLIAIGAALLVVGGVLGAQAEQAGRDLEAAISREPGGLPTTEFASVAGFESNGRAYQTSSIVTLSVGGAAALTGLALFALPRAAPKRVPEAGAP